MSWIEIYNGTFFITIATLLTGSLALCVKYCLKSKCDRVEICCGLVRIHREVELENEVATDAGVNGLDRELNI